MWRMCKINLCGAADAQILLLEALCQRFYSCIEKPASKLKSIKRKFQNPVNFKSIKRDTHCVKSVQIRTSPYLDTFHAVTRLKSELY